MPCQRQESLSGEHCDAASLALVKPSANAPRWVSLFPLYSCSSSVRKQIYGRRNECGDLGVIAKRSQCLLRGLERREEDSGYIATSRCAGTMRLRSEDIDGLPVCPL